MAAKKKKTKVGQDEEMTTNKLQAIYTDRCRFKGIPFFSQNFIGYLDRANENQENLQGIHLWEEPGLNPEHIRVIMDSLLILGYKYVRKLRLWKIKIEDYGLEKVCQYVREVSAVEVLDLKGNNITDKGCESLANMMLPLPPKEEEKKPEDMLKKNDKKSKSPPKKKETSPSKKDSKKNKIPKKIDEKKKLIKLKLDFNMFGSKGLAMLAKGLAQNTSLKKLSLCYCNIDADGAIYLQQILSFMYSSLEKLELEGNILKNRGVYELFRALEANNTLEWIDLTNNQFGECKEIPVVEQIASIMLKNTSLGAYIMTDNALYDYSAKLFADQISQGKHVYKCEISEHTDKPVIDELIKSMKGHKPKPKRGKKKRRGKKKK